MCPSCLPPAPFCQLGSPEFSEQAQNAVTPSSILSDRGIAIILNALAMALQGATLLPELVLFPSSFPGGIPLWVAHPSDQPARVAVTVVCCHLVCRFCSVSVCLALAASVCLELVGTLRESQAGR